MSTWALRSTVMSGWFVSPRKSLSVRFATGPDAVGAV